MMKVIRNDWMPVSAATAAAVSGASASVCSMTSVTEVISVLPLHRLVSRDDDGLPVEPDVVLGVRGAGVARQVGHGVLHVRVVVALGVIVPHVTAAALLAVA